MKSLLLFILMLTIVNLNLAQIYTPNGTVGTSSNGYVGVGTTVPHSRLHTTGGLTINGINRGTTDSDWGSLANLTAYSLLTSRHDGFDNAVHGFGVVKFNHFESPFMYGYERLGNKIIFGSVAWGDRNPATGLNPRMVISMDTGNVGIGTNAPEYELDVCGFSRAKEIIVETDWCDYVFNKEYRLPSLIEQKNFIEKNGHLKNFESEAAMNGQIHVGDVNKRQQQTIEEMMLYLIEMKAEITALKAENKVLKSEMESFKTKK